MNIKLKPLEFEDWENGYWQAHAMGYTYGILKGKWQQGPYMVDASVCGQSFWTLFWTLYCPTKERALVAANSHFGVHIAEWLEVQA